MARDEREGRLTTSGHAHTMQTRPERTSSGPFIQATASDGNVTHNHVRNSLDTQMRRVLIQLSLVSAIPAATYDRTAGSDDDPLGRRPPGDLGYAEYARWYGEPFSTPTKTDPGCRSDREREDCLNAAEAELDHLRRGQQVDPDRIETHEQTRERMLTETEGWSLQDIARSHWRTSVTIMRRARTSAGRDAETGLLIVHTDEPREDLASRARAMKDAGMSLRAIALALGLNDKVQVQRMLKRAA